MKASDIFKWRQVSTALSGNTESVRSDYKGKKYNDAYKELIDFAEIWLKKHSKSQSTAGSNELQTEPQRPQVYFSCGLRRTILSNYK